MKIALYAVCLLALLCVTPPRAQEETPPAYQLHEWGVFTVPRNDRWAQRDMKQEWATFPPFFYRLWPKETLPYRGPVLKPVIFFHAEKPLKLECTVRFAEGCPVVWWPAAKTPERDMEGRLSPRTDRITFELALLESESAKARMIREQPVDQGHWMEALREVKSAKLFCRSGHSKMGGAYDSETFVYYDGLMRAPASPKAARDGDTITIEAACTHAWLDVLAIERDGAKVRVSAWTPRAETGAQKLTLAMASAGEGEALKTKLEALQNELAAKLESAGLNKDEARSLVKVWREGLFEQQGLTLFYRIPQETYEAWLPLEANPKPSQTVRMGLVLHRHLEPELDARVDTLIKQLASEKFDVRDEARRALAALGGPAFPALEKGTQSEDLETAKACRSILDALDAKPAMEAIEKAAQGK